MEDLSFFNVNKLELEIIGTSSHLIYNGTLFFPYLIQHSSNLKLPFAQIIEKSITLGLKHYNTDMGFGDIDVNINGTNNFSAGEINEYATMTIDIEYPNSSLVTELYFNLLDINKIISNGIDLIYKSYSQNLLLSRKNNGYCSPEEADKIENFTLDYDIDYKELPVSSTFSSDNNVKFNVMKVAINTVINYLDSENNDYRVHLIETPDESFILFEIHTFNDSDDMDPERHANYMLNELRRDEFDITGLPIVLDVVAHYKSEKHNPLLESSING